MYNKLLIRLHHGRRRMRRLECVSSDIGGPAELKSFCWFDVCTKSNVNIVSFPSMALTPIVYGGSDAPKLGNNRLENPLHIVSLLIDLHAGLITEAHGSVEDLRNRARALSIFSGK